MAALVFLSCARRGTAQAFGELASQLARLLEPGGDVAHERGDPVDPAVGALQRDEGELEREPRAVLAHAGDREQIAVAVAAAAGCHERPIAAPVARAQPFRNDGVEALAERLVLTILKNAHGAWIPETDHAVPVAGDDCIARGGAKRMRKNGNVHP